MSRTIQTPKFRVSYPYLAEPSEPMQADGDPKYSVVMLFDKKTTNLTELNKLINEAIADKWPDPKKRPAPLRHPLRDGDIEKQDKDGYAGCYFMAASQSAKRTNGIPCFDSQKAGMSKEQIKFEIYPGCFCRAIVHAYAYDVRGNKGVAIGLDGVQKMYDGDSLTGRVNVEEAFDVVEDDTVDFNFNK